MIDAAHHLAARTVILGDSQGMAAAGAVQFKMPGTQARAGDRRPGAGGVVIGDRRVQREAGANGQLVPDRQAGHERGSLHGWCLFRFPCQRKKGGQHSGARMTLRRGVAVMGVDAVDGHTPGKGRTRRADAASVEEHLGGRSVDSSRTAYANSTGTNSSGAKVTGGMIADDP